MNEFVSVLDILENGLSERQVRDEVVDMDIAVKRYMDTGLTSDEMAVAQRVRNAVQAAEHALEKMFS